MKPFLSIFILFITYIPENSLAQNNNALIKNILQDKREVPFVSWQREPYMSTNDSSFNTFPQNLIKCNNNLYVFINGSGRLYKVDTSGNSIHYVRFDSTTNFGYNIGSFGFSYNNHLYNLGGYGYWRMNGQLRIFNDMAKQWDIIKLNQEIPILTGKTEGLIWYNISEKKIYTAYYLLRDEAVKTKELEETKYVYDVMSLDLQKNEWYKLGSLNSYLKDNFSLIKPITISPWGQLITIGDKISLLDFKHNQILSLDVQKQYYQSLIRSYFGSAFYFKDSTLFYGNNTNNSLDSVLMHYSDFIPTNEKLYNDINESKFFTKEVFYILLALITSSVLVLQLFFYRVRAKAKEDMNEQKTQQTNSQYNSIQNVFQEKEIQLLQLLIDNSILGRTTSIEEENKVLGLSKLSSDLQKKHRSDIITSINKKYSVLKGSEEPIIKKKRTEFDKRSFEYYIDQNRILEIKGLLK